MNLAPPIDAPLGAVTTERMNLRRFTESDIDALAEVFSKPEVWQFPYGRGFTKDETRRFVDSQLEDWEGGLQRWLRQT